MKLWYNVSLIALFSIIRRHLSHDVVIDDTELSGCLLSGWSGMFVLPKLLFVCLFVCSSSLRPRLIQHDERVICGRFTAAFSQSTAAVPLLSPRYVPCRLSLFHGGLPSSGSRIGSHIRKVLHVFAIPPSLPPPPPPALPLFIFTLFFYQFQESWLPLSQTIKLIHEWNTYHWRISFSLTGTSGTRAEKREERKNRRTRKHNIRKVFRRNKHLFDAHNMSGIIGVAEPSLGIAEPNDPPEPGSWNWMTAKHF